MTRTPRIDPQCLRAAIDLTAARALACGAMLPIRTELRQLEDGGMRFIVRQVSSLARKELDRSDRAASPMAANPFLPPEPELLVGALSDTHLAVLNKFNVIERHLLVVTEAFEHQESLLNEADFEALATCMGAFDSLGFYNGGRAAGASQPHKHLQVVPLPLAEDGPSAPVDALLVGIEQVAWPATVAALPFAHACLRLDPELFDRPGDAARMLYRGYRSALAACGITQTEVGGEQRQSHPYNLLLTRQWMLLVPRSAEHFGSISVNALGFAGSLFVKDALQLQAVLEVGPMAVLRAVSIARDARQQAQ